MRMPKELKQKWIDALRSGEYPQTVGTLCNVNGFCCLGVLEYVAVGAIELHPDRGTSAAMPSDDFYARNNITDVYEGFITPAALSRVNDDRVTFLEIADDIESYVDED